MEFATCDINTTDKIHRILIGSLLLLGVLLKFSYAYFGIIGIVVLIEGALGKCGIPILVAKYRELMAKR